MGGGLGRGLETHQHDVQKDNMLHHLSARPDPREKQTKVSKNALKVENA